MTVRKKGMPEMPSTERSKIHQPIQDGDPLPFFMTRAISDTDLDGKSAWELDVIRNEIYARHGRRFARKELQTYFSAQPWYVPRYSSRDFPVSLLTSIQQNNVLRIQNFQRAHGLSK